MAHPKSMYQVTKAGMQEQIAMSLEEEWDFVKRGWFPHPEEARQAGVQKEEKKPVADMTKKELEEYARTLGFELDRRKSKDNMLADLEDMLK
jgi:hypothetical protein